MEKSERKELNIFERNAKLVAVMAVFCGSTSAIFGKLITGSSIMIGFYRLSIALPFFAIPVLLRRRDELRCLTLKDWLGCGVTGMFLFAHFFFWFKSVQITTVASAIVIQSLHPLVVLLVTVLIWKKKVSVKAIIGIMLALIGGAIVAGFDYTMAGDSFFGDICAALAGTFMGLYFCMGNVFRKNIPAGIYVFIVFMLCWFAFLIAMIITGTPFTGYPSSDFFWLLLMALACQIGSHAVFNWSLGYVTSLYISTVEMLEIIFASLLAMAIFAEVPSLWQCMGGVVVIGGLLYYNRNS